MESDDKLENQNATEIIFPIINTDIFWLAVISKR